MVKTEPAKGSLLPLIDVILRSNPDITEAEIPDTLLFPEKDVLLSMGSHEAALPYLVTVEGRMRSHPRWSRKECRE
jgi:hypothetical protein